jgi:uncharacterized membrane protein
MCHLLTVNPQPFPVYFVIGAILFNYFPENSGMIHFPQVRGLMQNNVIDNNI